jgi:uncharacterized LabA/DUF88 family protein
MEKTLVFIDEGFLSKLSRHFGNGNYLKIDYLKFAKNLSKKQNLLFIHLFYYTAPPHLDSVPTEDQIKRKKGYDKFVSSISKNKEISVFEGRCQKILEIGGKISYSQKGVDALMVADMVSVPIKFPEIKKIVLVTSDTDFCPIIKKINDVGIGVILYTYYERKRNSKFSVSHHLIDCCENTFYLNKQDFKEAEK